jgi:hypothetical protein
VKRLTNKNGCDLPDLRGLHVGQRDSFSDTPYSVNVFVVGDGGIILAADDRVVHADPAMLSIGLPTRPGWHKQLSPTTNSLYSISFTADNMRGVAVGDAGTILMTDNSGETWSTVGSGQIDDNLRGVHIIERELQRAEVY